MGKYAVPSVTLNSINSICSVSELEIPQRKKKVRKKRSYVGEISKTTENLQLKKIWESRSEIRGRNRG